MGLLARYANWLHLGFPDGEVEKLPVVQGDGSTAVPGLWVAGDLRGIPLLKFAAESGAQVVGQIAERLGDAQGGRDSADLGDLSDLADLIIVGGGVAGMSAALEAKKRGLNFKVIEARAPFATIADFPLKKPIFTYPTAMKPAGDLKLEGTTREALLAGLLAQREAAGIQVQSGHITHVDHKGTHLEAVEGPKKRHRARHVLVAIGRSGDHRTLNVPGHGLDKITHRLHDAADHAGQDVMVVGCGDAAVEAAVALNDAGAKVTLSYRKKQITRPNAENHKALVERADRGEIKLLLGSNVAGVDEDKVRLRVGGGGREELANDALFVLIGREAPLEFFRRSGVPIRGEWRLPTWATFAAFLAFCTFVYLWKAGGSLTRLFQEKGLFPFGSTFSLAGAVGEPGPWARALSITLQEPGFFYSLAYTLAVILFGLDRMWRRRTPYVRLQTLVLMAIQLIPLFLLPYLFLPLLGHQGFFDEGLGKIVADGLFPAVDYGHGREYWRAFGFILAWPLFIWNVFTAEPLWWWLGISLLQTFVAIPILVFFFGKGAYCGWICSCGALAETLGDRHRQKMPHGAWANKANLAGQVILAFTLLLLGSRLLSWAAPQSGVGVFLAAFYQAALSDFAPLGIQLNYKHVVDILLAGIVGVGFYFWFSGRVWCRFFCPLAALMNIYARFSRFAIFAEKAKCISCNVCTTVCHQGIDVMSFANKGAPMTDPQCVRCSACVSDCPTGVLSFGRTSGGSLPVIQDRLPASLVQMREKQ
jgi:thioredoxin reductase/Fe-S-cluster-containing hydrogenase component 2